MLASASSRLRALLVAAIVAALLALGGCAGGGAGGAGVSGGAGGAAPTASEAVLASVPAYDGSLVVELNGGEPAFTDDEIADARARGSFEEYGPLDGLERCTAAYVNVGRDLMPTGERPDIHEIHPTGWHSVRYSFVDQESLYNRCHLVAFQLAGEGANERNLITGTRTMNAESMLPYEEEVGDYVRRTGNHVLYRVTPVFEGDELVARGVQMEALSLEDGGRGVRFDVFCYNVEPGVGIDYATGASWEEDAGVGDAGSGGADGEGANAAGAGSSVSDEPQEYVLNTNSRRFHRPDCEGSQNVSARNRETVEAVRSDLIAQGYIPCGICQP